ncbi:MAG: hypothetical protein AAB965_00645 [Patescibacteria group bacterium]
MVREFLVPQSSVFVGQHLELISGQWVNVYRVYVGGQTVDLDIFTRKTFLTPNEYTDLTVVVRADDKFFYYEEIRVVNMLGEPFELVRRSFKLPNEKS